MTFTLRPYQLSFITDIRSAITQYRRIVACAATGSGKSKTFITIATSAISKGRTVLILSESTKIYDQISREVAAVNINAGSNHGTIRPNAIYLAMAQTLMRRTRLIEQFAKLGEGLLIINDEAHIGTATKILQALPSALLIGFTATPDFRFAKHLPLLYNAIVIGPQPEALVSDGFLASYRHFARVAANLDLLAIRNGEFTEESQEQAFESQPVYDGLIDDLRKVTYRKAIIFTSSIRHCAALSATLRQAGFVISEVHSKLPAATSSYNLGQFTNGSVNICVSVGVLTKGFDFPAIDLVVLQRATTSLPLYLQMLGRGSRPADGKQYFTVLDYGGNYQRHGLWDAERDWKKMWNQKPKKKAAGVAPVKLCPKCEYIVSTMVMTCPNCGHVFQSPVAAKVDTELIEVTAAYRQMIGRRISELTAKELSIYARLKNQKDYAARVARAKAQSGNDIFLKEFCKEMGYKPGWAYIRNGPAPTYRDFVLK